MRNRIKVLFMLLLVFTIAKASISQTVVFAYDDNGNRISREVPSQKSNFIKSTNEEFADGELNSSESSRIMISPNPTHGEFVISMHGLDLNSKYEISLYNSIGVLVWKEECSEIQKTVDINDCVDGFYFLNIINGETKEIWKIIKE